VTLKSYYHRLRAPFAHPVVRTLRRLFVGVAAVVAVVLAVGMVSLLTIELGPVLRDDAEEWASDYLDRPLHIGRLSFRLWTGRFLIEDVVIEGLDAESPPFLEAKRIEVAIPWETLVDRRFVLSSIEMTDWRMHLEVRPDGSHSLPRITPGGDNRDRQSGWTTTLQWVRAHRGEFTYQDHGTPWSIVTRNLDVEVARPGSEYRGRASFSDGLVSIQNYEPFGAEMTSAFAIDGPRVVFDRIDLRTDGAQSLIHGDVNLGPFFPEMMYRVESEIDFERMREIFFANEDFTLAGDGTFSGFFHLFKEPKPDGTTRTGRELTGTFSSRRMGVDDYRFDDLRGSVRWTSDRLAVTNASASVYGGRARFGYEMAPLGVPGVRTRARFDATFNGVSVARVSEFYRLDGVRLAGDAAGRVNLQWPVGRFAAERRMGGEIQVTPPDGVVAMSRDLPVTQIEQGRLPRGPSLPLTGVPPLSIGASLRFELTPTGVTFEQSHVATPRTFVEFAGSTGLDGTGSTVPFHVSSADWQESYRIFATLRTAFGSRTGEIDVGGYGTFDGVLHGAVGQPRIDGTFAGTRIRAFDVEWGTVDADVVIEDAFADVARATLESNGSRIVAEGRFALGFPRQDGAEELNARVTLERRPLADLRHAFGMDRYPVDGLVSGEFRVFGNYTRPFGYGTLDLSNGRAYGEPFDRATAQVALEGEAVRLNALSITKGGSTGSGAVYATWDGSYSFDFAATAIPIESIESLPREQLPLSGLIDFTASGSGTFAEPRYSLRGTVRDLFAADEGIGQVDVREVTVVDDLLTVNAKVASPRLDVDVVGRVDLSGGMYSDLTLTFLSTSLDPYVRIFEPRLSPFTTAVVSGAVRVVGELRDRDSLQVAARIDDLDLRLFDYPLRNASPFRIAFERDAVLVSEMVLFGADTALQISGAVGIDDEQVSMTAVGNANLAMLQGFVSNIRSSGRAVLSARVSGSVQNPVVDGAIRLENGRIRHFGAPHALENISGPITFDSGGLTLDGLTARLGEGPVQFGGRIDKEGLLPGRVAITLAGQNMRVRYPQGMQSVVDANLTLEGVIDDLRLGGQVVVRDALYSRPFPSNLFQFIGGDTSTAPPPSGWTVPLTYDGVRITATSSIRVQNTGDVSARLRASADLELQGTYDSPGLIGEMEISPGGEFTFLGKRYSVTQGVVYFNDPRSFEPYVDLEAETRVRVPGETYRITTNVRGLCCDRLDAITFTSDPALPQSDILALLFTDIAPESDIELRRFRADSDAQQRALREFATQAATGAVSAQLGRTLEEAFGFDRVQITPSFVDRNQTSSRLDPSVRLRLEKRLSSRAFLTYSRSLSSSSPDEIIQLEYDHTDRFTWVLSRNEDQTYAVEVRVRHAF
jgi:hypothetical protein